jgi:hypothetical protein
MFFSTFRSLYWNRLATDGAAVHGPLRLGTVNQKGICMEASHNGWLHTTCLLQGGTWTADFQGRSRDRRDLFEQILNSSEPQQVQVKED